jgi:phenylpyruvate tautomerase PptA (4-oxalocrotonate tautomerase family)
MPGGEAIDGSSTGQETDIMPLVRISLIKGKPPKYIRAVADGVHRALHEAYAAPIDDRFQLIEQRDAGELIYDPDYLGIHRTDDIIIIHVFAGNWRDNSVKQAFYKRVVELLANDPGVSPQDVQIVISSNDRADWSLGNGIASYMDR